MGPGTPGALKPGVFRDVAKPLRCAALVLQRPCVVYKVSNYNLFKVLLFLKIV